MKFNLMFLSDDCIEMMQAILQTAISEKFITQLSDDIGQDLAYYDFVLKNDTIFLQLDGVQYGGKIKNVIIYVTLPFIENPKIMEIPF